ncbi:MAG: RNA 2',3'-cyclic phosphodiesterase [Oscillospiraceae bacterium]
MRLFIAVNFDQKVKDSISRVRDDLAALAESCRPTRSENLHLTLAFLGEHPPSALPRIRRAMEKAVGRSFELTLSGVGRFRRREGDILWMGVEHNPHLWALAEELGRRLMEEGFPARDNEFKPHITLCRNARMPSSFDPSALARQKLRQRVDRIYLMESSRIKGVLTYTPLLSVSLKPEE